MISIIILIFFSKTICQIYTLYETSDENINYSNTLFSLEMNKIYITSNNYSYSDFQSEVIYVDQVINNTIQFFQHNIDYGIGYPIIYSMFKENENLNLTNISVYFNHDKEKVFYPQKVKNKKVNLSSNDYIVDKSIVNCSFSEMYYNTKMIQYNENVKSYKKFYFFLQYTFTYLDGNVYYIKENFDKGNIILFERADCEGIIDDFYFSYKHRGTKNQGYLFFNIPNDNKICIYSLTFLTETNTLVYHYYNSIINIENSILDIKSYKDYIYYSIKGTKKIYQILINDTSNILNTYSYNTIKNDFISFIILNNTIYAIEKEIGLIIFNKTSPSTYHRKYGFEKAFNIDYFINPFTGFEFIGLYLNNTDNIYSDFFIEFILTDEYKPKINKALLYPGLKKPIINQVITFDYFFTYIYDIANNQIIMIKRGSLNKIPFASFKISINNRTNIALKKGETLPSYIFPIYIGNNKTVIGFLEEGFFYRIEGNFVESNLTCFFNYDSLHQLIFLQYNDICYNFNFREENYCRNILVYNFNVLKKRSNHDERNLFIVFFTFLGISFILIFFLVKYKKRIKEGKMNINPPFTKNDRKYLYETVNDINNKNNKKNQNIGEFGKDKEPLINDINNNNFGGVNDNFIDNILKNNKERERKGYDPHKNKMKKYIFNGKENEINNNNQNLSNNQKITKAENESIINNLGTPQRISIKHDNDLKLFNNNNNNNKEN